MRAGLTALLHLAHIFLVTLLYIPLQTPLSSLLLLNMGSSWNTGCFMLLGFFFHASGMWLDHQSIPAMRYSIGLWDGCHPDLFLINLGFELQVLGSFVLCLSLELRALHLLVKCFPTWAIPLVLFAFLGYLSDRVWFWPGARFRPQSSYLCFPIVGITDECHHAWLVYWGRVLLTFCLGYLKLPILLPCSWDYRYWPLHSICVLLFCIAGVHL
jgi:hypothetical protein